MKHADAPLPFPMLRSEVAGIFLEKKYGNFGISLSNNNIKKAAC